MARRNIVERCIRADIEKRVEIILDNYGMFNRILGQKIWCYNVVQGEQPELAVSLFSYDMQVLDGSLHGVN